MQRDTRSTIRLVDAGIPHADDAAQCRTVKRGADALEARATAHSVAWQLWHIAEVEDNWVRELLLGQEKRFPFNVGVRKAQEDQYPTKRQLLDYMIEVRGETRHRLDRTDPGDFDRRVNDLDFGDLAIRDVWAGVVTSFSWHAGQIALTAKLLPGTPVETMEFKYWS